MRGARCGRCFSGPPMTVTTRAHLTSRLRARRLRKDLLRLWLRLRLQLQPRQAALGDGFSRLLLRSATMTTLAGVRSFCVARPALRLARRERILRGDRLSSLPPCGLAWSRPRGAPRALGLGLSRRRRASLCSWPARLWLPPTCSAGSAAGSAEGSAAGSAAGFGKGSAAGFGKGSATGFGKGSAADLGKGSAAGSNESSACGTRTLTGLRPGLFWRCRIRLSRSSATIFSWMSR
mmetsp:Transcript_22447/g.62788  ORF Transcript_22447/g.62788 Transcript_22447/m.62788 type:complete len:235 (-) Transcript_22447:317-1021(-)